MKKLNCFASGFSFAPARVIFQHGGEAPSQAPTPKGAEKKEQPDLTPEQVKAREQQETSKRDERLFKELKTKVDELNEQLKKGGEMQTMGLDKDISFQLSDIVKQLNAKLNLGLEITSLDIHSEGEKLVIHFWESNPKDTTDVEREVNIYIDPKMGVERHIKDLKTGQTKIEKK